MTNALNKAQKKYLRTLAHERKTIIWVGQQGLTDSVLSEIDAALDHHELVKLKIRVGERALRDEIAKTICERTSAELIQKIGNMIAIYRKNRTEPEIKLPKA